MNPVTFEIPTDAPDDMYEALEEAGLDYDADRECLTERYHDEITRNAFKGPVARLSIEEWYQREANDSQTSYINTVQSIFADYEYPEPEIKGNE